MDLLLSLPIFTINSLNKKKYIIENTKLVPNRKVFWNQYLLQYFALRISTENAQNIVSNLELFNTSKAIKTP